VKVSSHDRGSLVSDGLLGVMLLAGFAYLWAAVFLPIGFETELFILFLIVEVGALLGFLLVRRFRGKPLDEQWISLIQPGPLAPLPPASATEPSTRSGGPPAVPPLSDRVVEPHPGINMSHIPVSGDLIGLVIAVFFVFGGVSLFVPSSLHGALFPLFLVAELSAVAFYLITARRDRLRTVELAAELHSLNEPLDQQPPPSPESQPNS
jgi:hypothetical protein